MLATARDAATIADLAEIGIETLSLVVTDEASVKACFEDARTRLGDKGLDYLVNNAYVLSFFFLFFLFFYFLFFFFFFYFINQKYIMNLTKDNLVAEVCRQQHHVYVMVLTRSRLYGSGHGG